MRARNKRQPHLEKAALCAGCIVLMCCVLQEHEGSTYVKLSAQGEPKQSYDEWTVTTLTAATADAAFDGEVRDMCVCVCVF